MHPLLVGLLLVQAAELLDLLQGRQHPLFVRLQLLDALVQPPVLLLLPVLGAAVVEDLDVGGQGLVHDVCRHVAAVGKRPEQLQHLQGAWSMEHGAWSMEHGAWSRCQVSGSTESSGSKRSLGQYLLCHIAVLIVLGQSPDQLQQLLPLLGGSAPPARLEAEVILVPVELAPVELVPIELVPIELVPVELVPVKLVSIKLVPVKLVPIELVPIKLVPVKLLPVELFPVKLVPIELVLIELVPV